MLPNMAYDYAKLAQQLVSGERRAHTSAARGFLAGAVGGLIGTALKSVAEVYFPPRGPREDAPPATLAARAARAVAGERLSDDQKAIAEQGMHWLFGTLMGGAYGAAVEYVPQLSDGLGLPFGTAVFGVMHEGILPAADLEAPHAEKDDTEERNEMITHLVYGFATEVVRGAVRPLLAEE